MTREQSGTLTSSTKLSHSTCAGLEMVTEAIMACVPDYEWNVWTQNNGECFPAVTKDPFQTCALEINVSRFAKYTVNLPCLDAKQHLNIWNLGERFV
jgi:hypothetical protein